ncbi:hypothetical protein B0T10DRAFT_568245 [Thelonectria olida]|uniref:DUF7872 domain-containing protein n=1 Tax=Thelonectria olida TaxID=1576542 RepID=A0A9P8VQ36_9HYPO|nr:hypothetical protein B0T10DRAFT_568245 [Thelonectria olida]
MQFSILILQYTLMWVIPYVFATPLPQSDGRKSCDTEPLSESTWTSLDIDAYLKSWAANVTTTPTNNVQSLADSFGAPNFFCGLDQFCNAGQPCTPVEPPAWYALVAIQNWNNYMNSINTAVGFSSNIISLTLPGIVSDLYPKPDDNVTPLRNILRAVTSTIGVIPFAGTVAGIGKNAFEKYTNYALTLVNPPTTDKFLSWTNVAESLAGVIQDYQAAVSDSLKKVLDTPVADAGGIYEQLQGGRFLGISQNFTQSDLQRQMIDSFKVYSIGLALQAQKMFIVVWPTIYADSCTDDASSLCQENIDGTFTKYILTKTDSYDNLKSLNDIGETLTNKYGLSKERFLVDVYKCYKSNGKKQLTDNFGDFLPIEPTTQCLLNLIVCEDNADHTIVKACRDGGADI